MAEPLLPQLDGRLQSHSSPAELLLGPGNPVLPRKKSRNADQPGCGVALGRLARHNGPRGTGAPRPTGLLDLCSDLLDPASARIKSSAEGHGPRGPQPPRVPEGPDESSNPGRLIHEKRGFAGWEPV